MPPIKKKLRKSEVTEENKSALGVNYSGGVGVSRGGGCYKESTGGRIIHQWNIKSYIIVYIVQRFCSCLKGVVLPERVAEI